MGGRGALVGAPLAPSESVLALLFIPWLTFAPTPAAPAACLDLTRAELAADGGFDTVRVVTADDGAADAASVVAVAAADRFTSVTARSGGASTVELGLGGAGLVTIGLEPELTAAAPACVERIELLRAGAVIARLDVATGRASW